MSASGTPEIASEWSRVLWLDQEIRAGAYPSRRDLQEQFGCSLRTAASTVSFLRGSLRAPLEYSRARRGYYYSDPTFALPNVFLREGELLGLFLAEQVSREYLGTALEAPLREAILKLSRHLPNEVAIQASDLASAYRFSGGGGLEVPYSTFALLEQSIRERRLLRIEYFSAHRGEWTNREVEPHFLRNVRGDWTLVAWDRLRNTPREFMLARISKCDLSEIRFTLRPELTPEAYQQHQFLTEHGGEPYEVELRFDAYQARWIRERKWHHSQELEEHEDGGLTLRLTISGNTDLHRWILGYGSHVEVMRPQWLRERIAEELKKALMRYGLVGLWMWW
jgi:predicted DNA-binding transcriptional regulator YafY